MEDLKEGSDLKELDADNNIVITKEDINETLRDYRQFFTLYHITFHYHPSYHL